MSGLDELSREELCALIAAQALAIDELKAQNAALTARVVELERRLAQNSRNSSKPPSADGPGQAPPPRSLRRKTGRKPGKQPGAQGFSLSVADVPASYGPNLRSWVVYLLVFQHIPVARVVELVADLSGARPSTGWVSGADRHRRRADRGREDDPDPADRRADPACGRDRGEGHRCPLVAVCGLDTDSDLLPCGPVPWPGAINTLGVLPGFTGVAVHDAWASYDRYDCTHALCGAHIARELIAAGETHADRHWPLQAIEALFGLNTAAQQARDRELAAIPSQVIDPLLHTWRHAILVDLATHPRRPGCKQSKTRNLLERLRDREAQVLRFAHDLSVPFTNNQAERDLRPTKTQMKISGTFRSETDAQAWARIRGYVSTARKHGINAFEAILAAVTGNPWTPPLPTT